MQQNPDAVNGGGNLLQNYEKMGRIMQQASSFLFTHDGRDHGLPDLALEAGAGGGDAGGSGKLLFCTRHSESTLQGEGKSGNFHSGWIFIGEYQLFDGMRGLSTDGLGSEIPLSLISFT